MTIKMRILIPMIAFTIIASSVILLSDIFQFSQYVESDISNRLNMAALTALSEMDGLKAQAHSAALYISTDPYVIRSLEAGDDEFLLRRINNLQNRAGIKFCSVADKKGIIRVSPYNPLIVGGDASVLPSVKSALSGRAVTAVETGVSTGMSIYSSTPIYGNTGDVIGVVGAGFPLSTNDFVDSIKEITGCEVTICQNDVRVATTIMQGDGANAIGTKAPSDISGMVLEGNVYEGRAQVMNNEMITRYNPIFGDDGQVVGMLFVGHYTDEETRTVSSFIKMGTYIMVFCGIVFVIIIMYIAGRIVLPINEAADVLSQIAKGNFEARIVGEYNGDLAKIKNSVNSTAEELTLYLNEKIHAEQLANESELAKARAEEASIIKSEFLASMSHEIRTPMNAIIGMAEILSLEPLNKKQHSYVKDIQLSSTALLSIINDILDMSKIEVGKLSIIPVHFELAPMLNGIYSMMLYTAENKGIRFIFDIDEEMPKFLFGDDVRLRQILLNLLSNGIKFTDEGYVCLTAEYNDGVIRFTVTDTGIGVREADIGRLFESFEQTDAVKNRHRQGTGLGLPITKSLVEMMNGEISVSSVYGEGTEFVVELPLPIGDESLAVSSINVVESLSAKDAQILLVDDNEANLKVGSGILKLNDIDCDMACDGFEALQMVQQKDYDIVFMDHMMPGMDGVEATKRIRALGGKYEELVIIALTANAVLEARDMFMEAGMNDFLAKPIERALLIHLLKKWLPKEKVLIGEKITYSDVYNGDDHIMTSLRQIDAIDVEAGLRLTSGSTELYKDAVKIVKKRMKESLSAASEFLEKGNLERFAIDIHGIKSSMATVGAETLSGQAYSMEKAANEGDADFCGKLFPEFSEEFLSLYEKLHEVFIEAESAHQLEGDIQTLIKQLEDIKSYIQEFDDEAALDMLSHLNNYDFGERINEMLEELIRQIEIFEYESALEIAEDIAAYL